MSTYAARTAASGTTSASPRGALSSNARPAIPTILSDKGGEAGNKFGDVERLRGPRFEEITEDVAVSSSRTGGPPSASSAKSRTKSKVIGESSSDETTGGEDPLDLFDADLRATPSDSPATEYSPIEEKSFTRIESASSSRRRPSEERPRETHRSDPSAAPDPLGRSRLAPHQTPSNSSAQRTTYAQTSGTAPRHGGSNDARNGIHDPRRSTHQRSGGATAALASAVNGARSNGYDQQRRPQLNMDPNRRGPARPVPMGISTLSARQPLNPNLPPRPATALMRNFEIRIGNIPKGMKKDELYHVLSEGKLDTMPFSTRKHKLNFWIHLPRARGNVGSWGQVSEGFGFLTLPSVELAHRFLQTFGVRGGGRAIRPPGSREPLTFEPGLKVPPAGLVEWLGRVPYPEKGDNTQRALNDRKADGLHLERLEWGVYCRDGIFSPEFSQKMKHARFSFDPKWRTFRLSLQIEAPAFGQPSSTKVIAFKSSSIRLILSSTYDDEHSCTLVMHHPPSYEQITGPALFEEPADLDEAEGDGEAEAAGAVKPKPRRYTGRQRRPAWSEEHQKTSAFTSRIIRFVFDSEQLLDDFEDLLQVVGCPAARRVDFRADARRLYSNTKRASIHAWLDKLDSRAVAFQLARLYYNGLLVPSEVLDLKPLVEDLLERKKALICADVLHQFAEELVKMEDRWYDRIAKDQSYVRDLAQNVQVTEVLQGLIDKSSNRVDWKENHKSQIMQCLHVILTPTSMILEGPYPDQSNRPLRKYGNHDHFVRVAFMDEDKQPYYWGPDIDWTAFLEERVGAILRQGFKLGGRQYQFLGYSMSSLRSRSTWFCTPFQWQDTTVDAGYIRDHLGDFEKVKRQPARYGARMAQAFTATDPSIVLEPDQIKEIPDIERVYKGEVVCFTDGVGKISLGLMRKVWAALHNGMEPVDILPSAVQFRLGGYKGVLLVDSELEGDQICVRPSQQKFDAPDSLGLEIAYVYVRHMFFFLNRPLIKVLEDLGVQHRDFLDLSKDAVRKAEELKIHVRESRRQLTLNGLGESFSVTDLVENIGSLLKTKEIEPFKTSGGIANFIAESLEFAEVHILRLLKLKARIPVLKAHVGVAVADESGVLKEGEIYALRHNPGEPPQVVAGEVLLVRAPTVDVGDVQKAMAVGVPPPGAERFKHLPNVVIFSTQGEKPLLSSLARGDMDGDLVGVIQDRRLFPRQTEPAMQHKPKTPKELDYDCTIEEVIDFVIRFFRNDILGMIANRHLLIADQAPGGSYEGCGTRHPACKKLAELQTVAVDAPKSGQSIDLDEIPRPLFPHRPDFMQHEQLLLRGEADEEALIYHSQKILGKLYRAIRLSSREENNQIEKDVPSLNADYIPAGEGDHVLVALTRELQACGLDTEEQPTDIRDREEAWYAMHTYAADLRHIAWSNTINSGQPLSEHELFIGTILHGPLATKLKQELIQRINLQCKELIDGVLHRLEGTDGREQPQLWTNRVLAALRVAVSQSGNFGAQTFACIAIKSALYILALMKDVRIATATDYAEDEPFQPTFTAVLEGDEAIYGTSAGMELSGPAAVEISGDVGGEATRWGHEAVSDSEENAVAE